MKFLFLSVDPVDIRLPPYHEESFPGAIYLVIVLIATAVALYYKKDKE